MMYIQLLSSGLQMKSFAATAKKEVIGRKMVKKQPGSSKKIFIFPSTFFDEEAGPPTVEEQWKSRKLKS